MQILSDYFINSKKLYRPTARISHRNDSPTARIYHHNDSAILIRPLGYIPATIAILNLTGLKKLSGLMKNVSKY